MSFNIFTTHQYIIKVDYKKILGEGLQDLLHELHKYAWSIAQEKGHYQSFIESLYSLKDGFPFISWLHSYLVVPILKFNLENILEPYSLSIISSNLGIENLYLIVILFI